MMKRTTLLAAVLCLCACDDTKPTPETEADVLTLWTNAGLTVGNHEPFAQHNLGDADCQRGEVGGVETTICGYESAEAAKSAQPAGLAMVGRVTGASLPRGKMLLVVADRNNTDLSGKTINTVTKVFLGR